MLKFQKYISGLKETPPLSNEKRILKNFGIMCKKDVKYVFLKGVFKSRFFTITTKRETF